MSRILWLGTSPTYNPIPPTNPTYCFPASEDWVLRVAFDRNPALLGPSPFSAICCTSRLALRTNLTTTGLNPPWTPYVWGQNSPKIVKAPASALSMGVCYQEVPGEVEILRDYCPELARIGVVEDAVGDEQWEIDGCIVRNSVHYFRPLLQHWDKPNGKILRYEPREWPRGLQEATESVLEALQMDNTPFCFEFRRDNLRWYLIDAHCRLGEDPGLAEAMTPCGDPIGDIERFVDDQTRHPLPAVY